MTTALFFPHRIGLARWIVRILGYRRVHGFPGLRASDENIRLRTEPSGIVKRADAQPDHIRPGRHLDIQRGPAVTAKRPGDCVAAIGLRDKAFRRALGDVKPRGGHADRRHRRGTTLALAIAAMAAQCEHDIAIALVTDRAAQTTAGSWCGHVSEFPGFRRSWGSSADVGKRPLLISRMRHRGGVRLDITPDPGPYPPPSRLARVAVPGFIRAAPRGHALLRAGAVRRASAFLSAKLH
jgi:hypothetical protein